MFEAGQGRRHMKSCISPLLFVLRYLSSFNVSKLITDINFKSGGCRGNTWCTLYTHARISPRPPPPPPPPPHQKKKAINEVPFPLISTLSMSNNFSVNGLFKSEFRATMVNTLIIMVAKETQLSPLEILVVIRLLHDEGYSQTLNEAGTYSLW